jgi:hypothetical protein
MLDKIIMPCGTCVFICVHSILSTSMLRHRRTPVRHKFLNQFNIKAIEILREEKWQRTHFFHGPATAQMRHHCHGPARATRISSSTSTSSKFSPGRSIHRSHRPPMLRETNLVHIGMFWLFVQPPTMKVFSVAPSAAGCAWHRYVGTPAVS